MPVWPDASAARVEVESHPSPSGLAAFVLYTMDETVVVLVDGSEPIRGEGLWLQDDRSATPRVSHTLILDYTRLERMKVPECSCEEGDGLCTADRPHTTRFDPATLDVIVEPDTVCRCADWPVSQYYSDDCDADLGMEFVSLVGGQLYSSGYEWNGGCGTASIYEALSAVDSLIEDPPSLDGEGMTTLGCDSIMPDGDALWPRYGEPDCFAGEDSDDDDSADCGVCEDRYDDDAIFMLRRGYLWQFSDLSLYGGRGRWISRRPARPENCPSVNDPCGDPEARADVETTFDGEHWIATDGRSALSATRYEYRVYGPEDTESHEFELAGLDASSDLLGVRHHADVQPLLAAMKRHATRGTVPDRARPPSDCPEVVLAPEDEGFVDERGGRGWGNRCFAHIKAARWNAAEAACQQGLEIAGERKVRGALLYNMGRIAEGRGDSEAAAEYYRESLEARPGNAAVRRRLESLDD